MRSAGGDCVSDVRGGEAVTRIRMVRAYPGKTVADAISRASKKRRWPMRTHNEPILRGRRWCWTVRAGA